MYLRVLFDFGEREVLVLAALMFRVEFTMEEEEPLSGDEGSAYILVKMGMVVRFMLVKIGVSLLEADWL